MPIASPEVYAEMLDRAKAGAFAYPAINVTSSQTLNAALRGFADAESDGIIQVSTGGAEYLSGPTVKDMVTGAVAFAAYAARGGQEVPGQHRAAHRPLPEGQARQVRPAADGHLEGAGGARARSRCSSRTCGTARPCRWRRTCRSPSELLAEAAAAKIVLEIEVGVVGGEEDGVVGAINEKLYTTVEDGLAMVDGARPGREGPLHGGADLRQRARRLQAGQRQAAPGDPQGDPGRGRRQVRQGEAAQPGLPRRLRLAAVGDPRGARLRRGEDEHRHRHPVRVHPAGRGPHVHATTTAC